MPESLAHRLPNAVRDRMMLAWFRVLMRQGKRARRRLLAAWVSELKAMSLEAQVVRLHAPEEMGAASEAVVAGKRFAKLMTQAR